MKMRRRRKKRKRKEQGLKTGTKLVTPYTRAVPDGYLHTSESHHPVRQFCGTSLESMSGELHRTKSDSRLFKKIAQQYKPEKFILNI